MRRRCFAARAAAWTDAVASQRQAVVGTHRFDAEFRMELQSPRMRRVAHRVMRIVRGSRKRGRARRQFEHALRMRRVREEAPWRRAEQVVVIGLSGHGQLDLPAYAEFLDGNF